MYAITTRKDNSQIVSSELVSKGIYILKQKPHLFIVSMFLLCAILSEGGIPW
jgi:hypothetical protein